VVVPPSTKAWFSETDYELVRCFVREQSGLELGTERRHDVDRALLEAFEESRLETVPELCAYLARGDGRQTLEAFLAALTIGESHFFRSQTQFEALRAGILPQLIAARRDSRRLRVWSAGCATGQEPYSLAIDLERLLPSIDDWDVLILATDISSPALASGQRGLYRQWSFREVPEDIRRAYFIDHGDRLEVIPRIRQRVTFAPLNLATDRYPSLLSNTVEIDLILCRNVLIYFSQAVAAEILGRLGDALSDGGWLMLGPAEAGYARQVGLVPKRVSGALVHQRERPTITGGAGW
jgi:chemotaxis protein methyltransferase CheR